MKQNEIKDLKQGQPEMSVRDKQTKEIEIYAKRNNLFISYKPYMALINEHHNKFKNILFIKNIAYAQDLFGLKKISELNKIDRFVDAIFETLIKTEKNNASSIIDNDIDGVIKQVKFNISNDIDNEYKRLGFSQSIRNRN